MAATVTVDDSIAFVQPFINWASLTIGANDEPAMTAANMTLQTIVGPPFVWPWNRCKVNFLTTEGIQDYNVSLFQFGFLESATLQLAGVITSVTVVSHQATFFVVNNFASLPNAGAGSTVITSGCTTAALNGSFSIISATPTYFTVIISTPDLAESESGATAVAGPIMPLELKWGSLGEASEQDRPTFISTQSSDESGVAFVFRLLPVPNTIYRVILTYQMAPQLFTATSNTWGIPNQLQYIYNYFFLFMALDYFDDPRAGRYRQLAVASLLARQSGLSETDRSLFLGNWLPLIQEEQESQQSTTQGSSARGL